MLQQAFSRLLFMLSLILSVLLVSTKNTNVYVQCSQLNFTSCEPSVNSLFTSLIESASGYNFNKFQISQQNDIVYGLYQCRGDISSPNCKDCVVNAVNQLKATCPISTGGQIQLETCFFKYDIKAFFGAQGKTEAYRRCGPSIGYNSYVLNRIEGALANLVGGNEQYFRSGEFENIRGVAQCVQDLSLSNCEDCLMEASRLLRSECETSAEGDMYLGKCYLRYATDQGNENLANRSCGGRVSKSTIVKWIGIIAAVLVAGVLLTLAIIKIKKCCKITTVRNITRIKNQRDKYMREAEAAESEAKLAKKKAEEAQKKAEDEKKKRESMPNFHCGPPMPMPMSMPMPMPPPCPYLPHSSPNSCNYM